MYPQNTTPNENTQDQRGHTKLITPKWFNPDIDLVPTQTESSTPVFQPQKSTRLVTGHGVLSGVSNIAKEFVAGGIPRMFEQTPVPATFQDAVKERITRSANDAANFNAAIKSGDLKAYEQAAMSFGPGGAIGAVKKIGTPLAKTSIGLGVAGAFGTAALGSLKHDQPSDDWESKTTTSKKFGILPGATKFERKSITHPTNVAKFQTMYDSFPVELKTMLEAMANQESVNGKFRVNPGDQKDKSDSVGLLHMGQGALTEFNKRKKEFGYDGPDIKLKDLKEADADVIQLFIQGSRILRDMNVNGRTLEDATTFIQNPGEKNYAKNASRKYKNTLEQAKDVLKLFPAATTRVP